MFVDIGKPVCIQGKFHRALWESLGGYREIES